MWDSLKWYVVISGHRTGVFSDEEEMRKCIANYPNPKVYSYKSRELAYKMYNDYLSNRVYQPRDLSTMNFTQIPYVNMPKYRGSVSCIPILTSSYQLIIHEHYQFNYTVYILHNYTQVYYFVQDGALDATCIKKFLNGVIHLARYVRNSVIHTSLYSIACAFEHGWVYQWVTNRVPVKDLDRWVLAYQHLKQHNVRIIYHPKFVNSDFIISVVEHAIFIKYFKKLQERNPYEYEKYDDLYFNKLHIPTSKTLTLEEITYPNNFGNT